MKAFHRLFLITLSATLVLAISLGTFLFISLVPYKSIIGLTAAGVVMVGLLCIAILMIAFTGNRIGAWSIKRRIIAHGEVVV